MKIFQVQSKLDARRGKFQTITGATLRAAVDAAYGNRFNILQVTDSKVVMEWRSGPGGKLTLTVVSEKTA